MASTPEQIHFVSRYDDRYNRGYTDLGGGLFSTEAWAVSADAAQSVKEVWLHDRKEDTAWRGGSVVGREPATVTGKSRPNRWRFIVRSVVTSGVTWAGAQGGGGGEKAYV